MAAICENCGKSSTMGRSHQHKRGVAGKRWKKRTAVTIRTFGVNIQKATVMIANKAVKMNLCTDCISKFKKTGKIVTRKRSQIATI